VARKLAPQLEKNTLKSWEIYDPRLALPKQNKKIVGAIVTVVERLGKQVVVHLNDPADSFIAIHLRMSGRLFWAAGRPKSLKEDFAGYQESFSIKSKAHLRL